MGFQTYHKRVALVFSVGFFTASIAHAAYVTNVADAADTVRLGGIERENLMDFYIEPIWDYQRANGKITREANDIRPGVVSDCTATATRDCLPVDEMRWKRTTATLRLAGQLGLFHDLALTFGASFIAWDTMHFRYAKGVNASTSTLDYGDGNPANTLVLNKFDSSHQGMGPIDLGLKFAPLNDERDASKPNWVLAFSWANPWAQKTYNPKNRATKNDPGPTGDGVHRLRFATALSKRIGNFGMVGIDPNDSRRGYTDPYVEFAYTMPIPQKGKALNDLIASKANRNFGHDPSHKIELNTGVEIVPVEDLRRGRKVAFDLGLRSAFFTEGRNYSELTDPLGELTFTEQYFQIGGVLGLHIQAAEFFHVRAGVSLGYITEHFLTNEEVGRDKNRDGQVLPPCDDTAQVKDRLNPFFSGNDPVDECAGGGQSYDQIGFRLKDEEHTIFGWYASMMLTF